MNAVAERPLNRQIMDAWMQAAPDLGIRVEIPFVVRTDSGDVEFYEGHLLDFGGPRVRYSGRSASTRKHARAA